MRTSEKTGRGALVKPLSAAEVTPLDPSSYLSDRQEENARAAQEWFANCLRLLKLQQRNAEFVRGWTGEAVEALREQTEHNAQTAEAFGQGISKQQEEVFGGLARAWAGSYREILSPLAYIGEGVRTFQGAAKQGLEATEQVARQGLGVA
jgi:hypothetical protein